MNDTVSLARKVRHAASPQYQINTEHVLELIDTLKETNILLQSIANTAKGTLTFFTKFFPWMVAAAGVLYPSIGKIIASIPAFNGN